MIFVGRHEQALANLKRIAVQSAIDRGPGQIDLSADSRTAQSQVLPEHGPVTQQKVAAGPHTIGIEVPGNDRAQQADHRVGSGAKQRDTTLKQ